MKIKTKKIIFLLIAFTLLGLLIFFSPYSLPGSANLTQVKKKVTPRLHKLLAEKELKLGSPIFMRIFKETNELEVWVKKNKQYELFKTYPICTYSGKLGPKLKVGDKQAPEGFYSIKPSQMNPSSRYHLSINLGFPNAYDRSHERTGNYLMIHGNCVSIGCYAMTDKQIEEIYLLGSEAFKNGQPAFSVHAFPFRMTQANLKRYENSSWLDFWNELKVGYDYFEKHQIPPKIKVKSKRYTIEEQDG